MGCLVRTEYWCIGDEREVNPGIWNQIGLELCQVHVKSTVKAKRSCDG